MGEKEESENPNQRKTNKPKKKEREREEKKKGKGKVERRGEGRGGKEKERREGEGRGREGREEKRRREEKNKTQKTFRYAICGVHWVVLQFWCIWSLCLWVPSLPDSSLVSHCLCLALGSLAEALQGVFPSSPVGRASLAQRLGLFCRSPLECTCSRLLSLSPQNWTLWDI